MKLRNLKLSMSAGWLSAACTFLLMPAGSIQAATVWKGPLITYTQPASDPTQAANQDRLTADVWLTRAASKGLFNAFSETNATALSPANTEWSLGTLTNYASLHYTNWLAWLNGQSPTNLVGKPVVVHLISDDIYVSIKFTVWVPGGTGGFAYQRSTPTPPTIWTGPSISVSDATQPDKITDNVWLTRGASQGIYNSVTEAGFTHFVSPADTEWSDGTTANYSSLTYTDWNTWVKGVHNSPGSTVGVNAVVHLISDNIYLNIKFTSFGAGGSYSYDRSTPDVVLPTPTISLINPAAGKVFAAPANITLTASANVEGGTVTNVQFFTNGVALGIVQAAPFSLTANNVAAGSYTLNAVATASGISATSSLVNVSVVTPVPVNLSGPQVSGSHISFNYTANAGLGYVVQSSSNLVNWISIATNVAAGSPVLFTNSLHSPGPAFFYRVGRMPNP